VYVRAIAKPAVGVVSPCPQRATDLLGDGVIISCGHGNPVLDPDLLGVRTICGRAVAKLAETVIPPGI
jgi:hypothetical protein